MELQYLGEEGVVNRCLVLPLADYELLPAFMKCGTGVFHVEARRYPQESVMVDGLHDRVLLRLHKFQVVCIRLFVELDAMPEHWKQNSSVDVLKKAVKGRRNRLLQNVMQLVHPETATVQELR